ncbi:hypothetical protein J6590_015026 [Homalodisca vitripennis]|nr:hypothetical protein J6590_015026 [Homalodisca vitripennis]
MARPLCVAVIALALFVHTDVIFPATTSQFVNDTARTFSMVDFGDRSDSPLISSEHPASDLADCRTQCSLPEEPHA